MMDFLKNMIHRSTTQRKVLLAASLATGIAILRRALSRTPIVAPVAFTRFLEDLRNDRVQSIRMQDEFYHVFLKGTGESLGGKKTLYYPTVVVPLLLRVCGPEIVSLIRKNGVRIGAPEKSLREKIFPFLLLLLPFVYLIVSLRMLKNQYSSKNEVGKSAKSRRRDASPPRFADVAGIDAALVEMREIVHFLRDPSDYQRIGAKLPKGILLWGPSGTGKTLLARAVATEAHVAFFSCSASDFVEMLVGRGAARVRDLFQRATKHKGPAIVFIDELDALGKARGGFNSNDEREQTLNQLLTEMDGFESGGTSNANTVLVIAATNRPQVLDPALIRPGRFDRHVKVGLPDARGREAVLRVHTRRVQLADEVDLKSIAARCTDFSGAELACLVNEAALLAVRSKKQKVDQHAFETALARSTTFRVRSR